MPSVSLTIVTKKGNEKDMNHLGIDVAGKRKYVVEQRLRITKEGTG